MGDGGVGGYHDGQTRGCDSDGGRWCRRLPWRANPRVWQWRGTVVSEATMKGKPAGVTVTGDGGVGGYHDGQTCGCGTSRQQTRGHPVASL